MLQQCHLVTPFQLFFTYRAAFENGQVRDHLDCRRCMGCLLTAFLLPPCLMYTHICGSRNYQKTLVHTAALESRHQLPLFWAIITGLFLSYLFFVRHDKFGNPCLKALMLIFYLC